MRPAMPGARLGLALAALAAAAASWDCPAAGREDPDEPCGADEAAALQLLQVGMVRSGVGAAEGAGGRQAASAGASGGAAVPAASGAAAAQGSWIGSVEVGPLASELGDLIGQDLSPSFTWAVVALMCALLGWAVGVAVVSRWMYGKDDVGLSRCHSYMQKATIVLLVMVGVCALILLIQYWAGAVVHMLIDKYSVAFLGVPIHLDRLQVNPFTGRVLATGIKLGNPPGFKTEQLAVADTVYGDVDMFPLVFSLAHRIPIDALIVKGAFVNYEKTMSTSNIDKFLDHLGVSKGGGASSRKVLMHQIEIEDVKAKATLALLGATPGVTVSVGDIHFKDFMAQEGATVVDDIIEVVLATLFKTVRNAFG